VEELTVSTSEIGGTQALKLAGELNFDTAPKLRRQLTRKVKKQERDIVVDLSDLSFMDTCGLATLIETRQRAGEYGGRVIMVGVSEMIREVMQITRVEELFTLVDDPDEAEDILQDAG
jgi:anti-sigma B factor antagonist